MRKTMAAVALLLLGRLIAGCSGDDAGDTTLAQSTTVAETTTTQPPTTTTAAPTTTATTAAPTTTTEPPAQDGCVTCHTDAATLQALAMEPVATEHLSEGEG